VFELSLDPSRPDDSPLNREDIDKDVDALYHASRGRVGKEKVYFCRIYTYRSLREFTKLYEILVKRSNSHAIEVSVSSDHHLPVFI
jgi:hypothetical protein